MRTQWEYLVRAIRVNENAIVVLQSCGRDGWELCAYREKEDERNNGVYYFKRPIMEEVQRPIIGVIVK